MAAEGAGLDLAPLIDHTLLKPDASRPDIERLCEEARAYGFAAVCVNPVWVRLAARLLARTAVRVASVVAFPLGAQTPAGKAREARALRAEGAHELDMVLNLGALKDGDDAGVVREIEGVVRAAGPGAVVKVILETCYLTRAEKIRACRLARSAGARFVKTSTGFGPGGATVEDVRLLRRSVGPRVGVKAAGGIRDLRTARAMVRAGASRIGTSAGVAVVTGSAPGAPRRPS
jgi:deoxyribose-phosphate aldolase